MKKFASLICVALLSMAGYAQNLVAHWDFNNNVNDVSGHGFNGTIVTGTATGTGIAYVIGKNGLPNTAVHFNNPTTAVSTGSYIRVAANPQLDLQKWTITARVRFSSWYAGNCQAQQIIGRGTEFSTGNNYYCMQVNDNEADGGCAAWSYNEAVGGGAAGWNGATIRHTPTSSYLNQNVWYCMTVTYDGNVVNTYVDGALTNSTTWTNQYGAPQNVILSIGCYFAGLASYPFWFNGDIDDIQLYDDAMSQGQLNLISCDKPLSDPWLTTGNNIALDNTFGTLTNSDVVIKTNSTSRGIFTKTGDFGFGTQTPGNKVEIKSASSGASGLRLKNIPNTLAGAPNPPGVVLSTDNNGDVILVQDASSGTASEGITQNGIDMQLGYACNGTPASLFSTDREIGLNNNHLYLNTSDMGGMYIGGDHCPTHPLHTRLELDTKSMGPFASNSYIIGQPSSSGLRFTELKATMTPLANLSNGVLSLDDEGDVIWVNTSGAAHNGLSLNGTTVEFGQLCGSPGSAHLMSDRELPMNDHNLIFRDGSALKPYFNRVGLGTPDPNCTPDAKLEVIRNIEGVDYDPTNIAISGKNKDMTSGVAIAVNGETDNPSNQNNVGGNFVANDAQSTTNGVIGIGQSVNGLNNFGGWFMACGNGNSTGIYATACTSGGGGLNYAGIFNGNIMVNTTTYVSDRRIKQNIQPINNALEILNRLQPKKYEFNHAVYPTLNLPTTKENYGVIAQELEQVLPSLVTDAPVPDGNKSMMKNETIKTVNYIELIPILIQAVKDQQMQIEELKTFADQQSKLKNALAHIDLVLANGEVAVLEQNAPNPYDAFTSIAFYLPQSVKTASIQFATVDGKPLKSIEISARGKGTINVYTPELVSGTYFYTMTADGKVVDTKKMQILR